MRFVEAHDRDPPRSRDRAREGQGRAVDAARAPARRRARGASHSTSPGSRLTRERSAPPTRRTTGSGASARVRNSWRGFAAAWRERGGVSPGVPGLAFVRDPARALARPVRRRARAARRARCCCSSIVELLNTAHRSGRRSHRCRASSRSPASPRTSARLPCCWLALVGVHWLLTCGIASAWAALPIHYNMVTMSA